MIRRAEIRDVARIWPKVREQERVTTARMTQTPEALLFKAICQDLAFAAEVNHELVCLWGIHFEQSVGSFPKLWLLTSDLVDRYSMMFLRESMRFVRWAEAEYGALEGAVDEANEVSFKWLLWLGFEPFESASPYIRMRTRGR